jgi:hypothetical protein
MTMSLPLGAAASHEGNDDTPHVPLASTGIVVLPPPLV